MVGEINVDPDVPGLKESVLIIVQDRAPDPWRGCLLYTSDAADE